VPIFSVFDLTRPGIRTPGLPHWATEAAQEHDYRCTMVKNTIMNKNENE